MSNSSEKDGDSVMLDAETQRESQNQEDLASIWRGWLVGFLVSGLTERFFHSECGKGSFVVVVWILDTVESIRRQCIFTLWAFYDAYEFLA